MRKGIKPFVIFFLLGAIINIAVAWSCVLYVPIVLPNFVFEENIKDRLPEYVVVRSDLFDFKWGVVKNRGRMLYMIMGTEDHSNNTYNIYIVAPLYVQCKAGWPMYSLDGSRFMTSSGLEQSFLLVVPGSFSDIVEYHYLPLKPLWLGFVINTGFFGGILWLLICGPFVLRRHRRHKRNQCVACGYPKGESDICSECGKSFIRKK